MDFFAYFAELTALRRAHPTADLASMVAHATIDGRPLEDVETFGYYLIVATAGHDTTSSAIAGGLLALLQHPEQWTRYAPIPGWSERAEEIVRWVSPVKHSMRTAHVPWELSHAHRAGDWVLLSYQSANRDEAVFTDPFRFDVSPRDAAVARFRLRRHSASVRTSPSSRSAPLSGTFLRLDHIELGGDPRLMHSTLVSGPKKLPVRFSMR